MMTIVSQQVNLSCMNRLMLKVPVLRLSTRATMT